MYTKYGRHLENKFSTKKVKDIDLQPQKLCTTKGINITNVLNSALILGKITYQSSKYIGKIF